MRAVVVRILCLSAVALAPRPLVGQASEDGGTAKTVIPFFEQRAVRCPSGATLTRTIEGTIQIIEPATGRFDRLVLYNRTWTFANVAGETFVLREGGVDRHWTNGGDAMIAVTGLTTISIGVQILNLTTGETTFEAGQELELPRVEACARLT
jgi:hypothetical protein